MSLTPASSPGSGAARRAVTFAAVVLCHVLVLIGPVWLAGVIDRKKPQENMFRVKIGGTELSSGPAVGMPERTPPPPQAEPEIPRPVPEPQIPTVRPPKAVEPAVPVKKIAKAKKVRPDKVKRPKVTPRPKREPEIPVVKPKPKPTRKVQKKAEKPVKRPVKKPVKRPQRKNPMDDVYRDPQTANLNPAVPTGTRNRAQKYASKADNRTPGGGKKVDEEAFRRYGNNVERYIYSRWSEPSRTLLRGALPETVIEVTIEADGRVSAAKIVKASGNVSMDESVKALISGLDLLPRPPDGRITFMITLKTR